MPVASRVGGFAAIALGVVLAAACSTARPKSPEQERADAATAERVYATLEADPVFYFRDVDVSVDNGVVQLSGYVWTVDALYSAQQLARRVPGVTGVRDMMELERQGNRGGGDGAAGE